MTTRHHPGEVWLLDFALGNLAEPFDTIVAAHAGVCAQCRETIALAEAVGGDLLAALGDAPLAQSAAAVVGRFEARDTPCLPGTRAPAAITEEGLELFIATCLERSAQALPWRRLGQGLRICRLGEQDGLSMWMLRAAPGTVLPRHRHAGSELTLVLKGAYFCGSEIYRAGDVEDADEDTLHQPVVTGDGECICLAVTEGRLRFEGWLPRLLQPFLKI